jgi:hypothetical protein
MEEILGDRSCERHPYCPKPCVQCAGLSLSHRDMMNGGFRGALPKFEAEPDEDDDDFSDTEVEKVVGRMKRQKSRTRDAGQFLS